jgi:hypothetical protein
MHCSITGGTAFYSRENNINYLNINDLYQWIMWIAWITSAIRHQEVYFTCQYRKPLYADYQSLAELEVFPNSDDDKNNEKKTP